MDKKKKNFKEVLNEMKQVAESMKSFNEAYIFDDEEPEMGPQPELQVPMQQPQQPMQGDSEEEKAMYAQEVIRHEPIIGKIREIAIDGLKKYADHPTSSAYEFMKKVFLEADKVMTDTGGK